MGGFHLTRSHGNGEVCGKLDTFIVPAAHTTQLAIGDVAVLTGAGDTSTGVPYADSVTAASPTGQVLGVIAGFKVNPSNLLTTGLAASVENDAYIIIDPNATYEVDVTGAAAPLEAADIGLNIGVDDTAATTSGGLVFSNMAVDADTAATTVTLPFRIEALLEDDAGVLGNRARVSVNNSTYNAGTVGV